MRIDSDATPDSTPEVPTPEQVADQLEMLAAAYGWFEAERRLIMSNRAPLSQVMVDRLVALGERLMPAAEIRVRLARLDPAVLMAGTAVWLRRRPPTTDARDLQVRAAARAERVWSGGDAA